MPWASTSSPRRGTLPLCKNSWGTNKRPTPCNTPVSPPRNSKGSWMSANPARPPLVTLTEEERARALGRYRLLQPHLEGGVSLTALARTHAVPLRTAQRWVTRYRQDGLAGLGRHARADRGKSRRCPPQLIELIEALALRRPPPTAAFVHRQITAIAAQQGWPVPSYRTAYAVMQHLDPALVTLAHDGSAAYRDTFDLVYRREAAHPNAIWQADHSLVDLWLVNDHEQPARPWLTVIMDDYSRAIAGFGVSFRAPSIPCHDLLYISAAFRRLTPSWHVCGIPAMFYTDHGSDFTSHHMEQVSA